MRPSTSFVLRVGKIMILHTHRTIFVLRVCSNYNNIIYMQDRNSGGSQENSAQAG